MQEEMNNTEANVIPFQPNLPLSEEGEIYAKKKVAKPSKKSRILELFRSGEHDIGKLAQEVGSKPSYVANVLQAAGLISGYFDLYTTTARDQNLYSRFSRNTLSYKTVEAAKESVARIARLYEYFERLGDRAGQHHAEELALIGRNRARWSGKKDEARIFEQWLFHHWNTDKFSEEPNVRQAA